MSRESKSIIFNKSIFYRAPCAEYIHCRHFDDDDVFFVIFEARSGPCSARGVVSRRCRYVWSPRARQTKTL
ncbi:unnamed protein product [Pieris brassicae]|uniref:Uncharacterized protein n=1 Tax=Pieris brassicae TaxID=7116 RepID=A0A9P0X8S5_PIEBR|nr:unnamed protein product [Pieris brassicae]